MNSNYITSNDPNERTMREWSDLPLPSHPKYKIKQTDYTELSITFDGKIIKTVSIENMDSTFCMVNEVNNLIIQDIRNKKLFELGI